MLIVLGSAQVHVLGRGAMAALSVQEPRAEKKRRVEQLLDRLALRTCQDTHIGDPMSRGVSELFQTTCALACIAQLSCMYVCDLHCRDWPSCVSQGLSTSCN